MPEKVMPGPVEDSCGIREAVCIHTRKIFDSCRDKDCIEDLQVYLTVPSQQALDCAVSAKARYVELLHVGVHVETVPYSTGYYTVDLTFYYRVIADASAAGGRPTTVTGLAIFSKRLVMFGGETSARSFSSRSGVSCLCKQAIQAGNVPEAIVEVVDPMILGSRVQEVCSCNCCPPSPPVIPEAILGCFEEQLVLDGESKRLLVTIGQFSIARLERSTQLLIPTFDYCIPSKTCKNVGSSNTESPCEVFGQIEFPMDAFFPSKNDSCIPAKDSCTNCAKTAT